MTDFSPTACLGEPVDDVALDVALAGLGWFDDVLADAVVVEDPLGVPDEASTAPSTPTVWRAATGVSLRAAVPADRLFLRQLSDEAGRSNFASLGLEEAALDQLLKLHYHGQRTYHQHTYPNAIESVIGVDGVDAGRLLVEHAPHRIHIADITVRSDHRRRGIATAVLTGLIEQSEATGLPLTVAFGHDKGGERMFARLGWQVTNVDSEGRAMTRTPAS